MPAGSFTITMAGGTTKTITTDGTQTLADVANQINGDGLGVTASVVTDSSGSRLAIVSNSSGAANDFSIGSAGSGFGFTQAAMGKDASLTVDGINITSASNTVTGAVPGLTLNLLSAQQGTEVSLRVAPDTTAATNAINQFVSDYNSMITQLTSQFTFNGTSEGVLATDSTVRSLQSSLLGAISYTYSPASGTTTVPNLSSLGISVGNDGKLTVDSPTLQNVLQNNYSDVQNFFQGSALNGFANSVDQQLSTYINGGDGAFTLDLQSLSTQFNDLQKNISNFETNYITPLRTQLQNSYSQAEIALQQLPLEMKQLNAELGTNNSGN
jgi:flagellar hook-associated protein 2